VKDEIARLRELLEKATPGAWEVERAFCGDHGTETLAVYNRTLTGGIHHIREVIETGCKCGDEAITWPDAELIAAAINFLRSDDFTKLLALADAVSNAPEASVYVIGTGQGKDLLALDPRDRQDRDAITKLDGRIRLVALTDGGEG
jgi:hypothetical protein